MIAVWPSEPPSSVATPARRAGEIADQAAADFAHFLGAPLAPRPVILAGDGEDRVGKRVGFIDDGGFGGHHQIGDALAHAAHQPRRADHLEVGVQHRGNFGLAVLGQDAEAGAQFQKLLARLGDRGIEAGNLGLNVGGLDFRLGDDGRRFGGAEHGADGNARRNRDADQAAFTRGRFFARPFGLRGRRIGHHRRRRVVSRIH